MGKEKCYCLRAWPNDKANITRVTRLIDQWNFENELKMTYRIYKDEQSDSLEIKGASEDSLNFLQNHYLSIYSKELELSNCFCK